LELVKKLFQTISASGRISRERETDKDGAQIASFSLHPLP
jgi:hypothetical protein